MKLKQQGNAFGRTNPTGKIVALYCRLSREDEIAGGKTDSSSIQTQKAMLSKYASDNNLGNCEFYVDDGASGVSFNRENFQRMITDMEDGKLSCIVTKDLSRLGRNYIEAGRYRELFAEHGVRFIAIGDSYDSFNDDGSDIATPIKEIIHEFYARDCSRKIKSAYNTKAHNGGYIIGNPAYGYRRVEGTTNRIEPDEAAPVVKRIFKLALEGKGCCQIANILKKEQVPLPNTYKAEKYGNVKVSRHPCGWQATTVRRLLMNQTYLGKIVNLKTGKKSFKDRERYARPEDEWVTTENAHQALVSEKDFNTVQERINSKQRSVQLNPNNIFRSLVCCSDCDKRMAFQRNGKSLTEFFRCANNIKYGKEDCSSHRISLNQLKKVVLCDIQKHAFLAAKNADKYITYLSNVLQSEYNGEKASYQKEVEKCQKRLSEIDTLIQGMYEDKIFGVISSERFISISQKLEDEQCCLKKRYAELTDFLKECRDKTQEVNAFAELVRQYTEITELDSELIHTLIEKIVIYEREVIDGDNVQRVDIYYRFIGNPYQHDVGLVAVKQNDKIAV